MTQEATMGKKKLGLFCLGCFLICTVMCAAASKTWGAEGKYPSRPIELLCAYPPGSYTDILARHMAKGFEKYLGVPVIPGNKPGGGEVVGANAMINAAPDGYTIGILSDGYILLGSLLDRATYQREDLRMVGQYIFTTLVMSVSTDSPIKSFQEFIDYARKNPGLTYGHTGVGSSLHIRAEYLNKVGNLKMRGVPFKGDSEIIPAVLGKHVMAGMTAYASARRQADAGKLRILFSFDPPTGPRPDPTIPTVASVFGKDVFDMDPPAQYVVAPKKTPEPILQILEQSLEKVTRDPEFVKSLTEMHVAIQFISGKALEGGIIERRLSQLTPILKDAGLIK